MIRFFIWLFITTGVFTSQFYIFSSGLPQPSHVLLAFFSGFFILFCVSSRRDLMVKESKNAYRFLFFLLAYVVTVNLFYSLIHQDTTFNIFSVYLVYNIILFCCVCGLLFQLPKAKNILTVVIGVSILSLLLIWILGFGRSRFAPRYNGFFNDPNQMAFWLLCLFSSFVLLNDKKYLWKTVLFGLCSVLIMATLSRSALVGLAVIFCGVALSFLQSEPGQSLNSKINKKIFGSVLSLIFAVGAIYIASMDEGFLAIYERFVSTDFAGQADMRGYTRIMHYPEYLLFGSGQGQDLRFNTEHEIHSTWAGIFFYYGLVGLVLFCTFLYFISRDLNLAQLAVFCGPLAYSASTFGARTPVFWFFLACVFYAAQLNRTRSKKSRLAP